MPTPVVLDCDTGTDDAVAIMLAALHPGLELLGVTTVWGNHDLATCTDNTLRVLHHIGRHDIPVVPGCARPIEPRPVPYDDRVLPPLSLPATDLAAAADDAVEWLLETLRASTARVTLVPTGPLTNIAAVVRADPGVVDHVDRVVLMGGAHARGNVTPYAERNVWNDPVAADVVVGAGFERLVMVTLDATLQAPISDEQAGELARLDTPAATAAARFIRERIAQHAAEGPGAAPVHDPLAVGHLLDPSVVRLCQARVTVETTDRRTYGRTEVQLDSAHPNAHVALDADAGRFFELLRTTLG
jgi:inosine-uridine nucleoside N-ribohydrolase